MNGSPLAVLLYTLFITSCDGSALFRHELIIRTPPRPEPWKYVEAIDFSVSWRTPDGETKEYRIPEGQELRIIVARGKSIAVTAKTLSGLLRLRSAAAFYPRDLESISKGEGLFSTLGPAALRLDYMRGYVAEVASCLEKLGKDPWSYPLERLAGELETKRADPWQIPAGETAESLVLHSFRIDRFFRKGMETVLPESAGWVPESPFCALERKGTQQTAALAEGVSVFYDERRKLLVSIKDGLTVMQIVPRDPDRRAVSSEQGAN